MADVYMYVDETGTLDFDASDSPYFGVGTATLTGDHSSLLWRGFQLRCAIEGAGQRLARGFHAKDDPGWVKKQVFELLHQQSPRLDCTLLAKVHARPGVMQSGKTYLYQLAFYLHFKEVIKWVSRPGDTVYVIVSSLKTSRKRDAIRDAAQSVCRQLSSNRTIISCYWDAGTAWGLQLVDYALWATQRVELGRHCDEFQAYVLPHLVSNFKPWGDA